MTQFLHSGVHRAFLRDLTRQFPVAGEVSPELFVVQCPQCRTDYFANPLREVPPLAQLAARRTIRAAARMRLERECPDHTHRFDIDL